MVLAMENKNYKNEELSMKNEELWLKLILYELIS